MGGNLFTLHGRQQKSEVRVPRHSVLMGKLFSTVTSCTEAPSMCEKSVIVELPREPRQALRCCSSVHDFNQVLHEICKQGDVAIVFARKRRDPTKHAQDKFR